MAPKLKLLKKAWLKAGNKKPSTRKQHRRYFKRLVRFAKGEGRKVLKLCASDLHRFTDAIIDLPANVQYRTLVTARSFYKFLHQRGHVDKNPAAGLPLPRRVVARTNPTVSEADMQLLIKQAKTMSPRHAGIVALMYYGGLRCSEAIKVKREDIETGTKRLSVLGKGNVQRDVYLNAKCTSMLDGLPASGFLFPSGLTKTGHICRRTAHNWLKDCCRRTQGASERLLLASSHWLRHSIATHMSEKGGSLQDVSKHLRHSNVAQTSTYLHAKDGCKIPDCL